MGTYLNDIYSQPQELRAFLNHYKKTELQEALKSLGKLPFKKILFSGMGSSHFCSLTADILLKQGGIDSSVVSTGELYYYERETIGKDVLLCLISQSGESGEIVRLIQELSQDVTVIGITNHPESTLGKRSNYLFPLFVSDEVSVTTRTYLASCAVTLLLAAALLGQPLNEKLEELEDSFDQMETWLRTLPSQVERWEAFMGSMNSVSVIGRGFSLPAVEAGALFFRETVRFPALEFDGAEFRHGPMEMVEDGFYGIVLAPSGVTYDLSVKLAKDIAARGGQVMLVTDQEQKEEIPNLLPIRLPCVSQEFLMFFQILPLQLLANSMAEYRGITAGQFRWGSKITKEG